MMRSACLAMALIAAAGLALAGTTVDRTIPLTGRSVSIEMIAGTLTVEGSGGRDVELKGVLHDRCEELDIDSDSEGVSIEVDWICHGSGQGGSRAADLTLRVPRGADLEVETISASVTVSGIEGGVDVETISGALKVRTESRSIDLASVSGPIDLSSSAPLEEADVETVSGSIELDVDPGPRGNIDVESVSGSVVIRLSASVSASFEVTSFSGSIRNDLGSARPRKTSQYLPSEELFFMLGGGGARISIETLSGRIELRER